MNTATVNISVENRIQGTSTPIGGTFFILGEFQRGPVNDPSTIISNPAQFERIFGSLTPGISNAPLLVKRALAYGISLRISRVVHHDATGESTAKVADFSAPQHQGITNAIVNEDGDPLIGIKLKYPGQAYNNVTVTPIGPSNRRPGFFNLVVAFAGFPKLTEIYENLQINPGTATTPEEYTFLQTLNDRAQFVSFEYVNLSGILDLMPDLVEYQAIGGTDGAQVVDLDYIGDPAHGTGVYAFDEYDDGLYIGAPDKSDKTIMVALAEYAESRKDLRALIRVPHSIVIAEDIATYVTTMGVATEYADISGGGLLVQDPIRGGTATLEVSEVADIMGLFGMTRATVGDNWSYSGTNRGIIRNTLGPVINFGSAAKAGDLNIISNAKVNMIVRSGGLTHLQGNFTARIADGPQQFTNVQNMVMYIQRTLKPILAGFLEEPLDIPLMSAIYRAVNPTLVRLKGPQRGLWDYVWNGDQNATTLDDLQINTREDVLMGIYRAQLVIIPIAAAQQINLNIILDTNVSTISIQ